MSGNIEEFLRRAAQRRQPEPVEEIVDAEVVDAEVIEELAPSPPGGLSRPPQGGIFAGEDVAAHVSQHLDTSVFQQRAATLGQRISSADDRMEAHLHEVFEHKLGDLGTRTQPASDSTIDEDEIGGPGAAAAGPVFDVNRLLGSADNVRSSIILSEIINRPEHRW